MLTLFSGEDIQDESTVNYHCIVIQTWLNSKAPPKTGSRELVANTLCFFMAAWGPEYLGPHGRFATVIITLHFV